MKNKKVLFFDIDGTLISGKTGLPEKTKNILEELSQNENVDMYISTGRGFCTLNEVKDICKYFTGLVLSNGQSLYVNNKNIHNNFISEELVKKFIKYCSDNLYSLGMITPSELFLNFYDEKAKNNFLSYCKSDYKEFNEIDDYSHITQFWLFVDNILLDDIKKDFPELSLLKWGKYGADVIMANNGKGDGIKKLIELMNYDYNNTFAFGDGENDVSMFKEVKCSIAMGNGCDYAKENATYVTNHINEDGLYNAIIKYVLK